MEVIQDTYRTINFGPQEYEVPNEWKVLKIKETSTLKGRIGWQGLTTKEYLKEGDYFLITGTDFKNGRIDWENCHFVDQDRFDQDTKIQIKKNDILITKDGTIGKVAIIASELSKPGTLNSGVFVLRPTNKDYLPIFMYYYLNSFFFSSFISQIKAGSTIAHLYQKDFEKYTFLVPSIQEQQKIAAILSTLDEQISNTNKIIEKSKELKKGLMQKLFSEGIGHTEFKDTKIGRIPKDWEVKTLEDVFIFNNGKGHEQFISENGDYIVVNSKFISQEGRVKKFSNKQMSPLLVKDITMVMSDIPNGRALAKCFMIEENNKYSLNQRICGLRLKNEVKDDVRFFFYNLNRNKGFLKYNDGVSQTNLRKSEVLGCLLAYPPSKEQQKIAAILSEADAKIEKEQEQKAQLELLKKGLMQQLLTGKKRVKV
ncbi:restriction endonuclease subunit S [Flavobacteriaceae bacterium]|nr:restriction endonuclease subunit S [Flavobacteriaceae bacterium]